MVLTRAMASSAAFSDDHWSSIVLPMALPQTFSPYTCEFAGLFEWSKIFVFRSRRILVTVGACGSLSLPLPTWPREKNGSAATSLKAGNQRPLAPLMYSVKRFDSTTNFTKAFARSGFLLVESLGKITAMYVGLRPSGPSRVGVVAAPTWSGEDR